MYFKINININFTNNNNSTNNIKIIMIIIIFNIKRHSLVKEKTGSNISVHAWCNNHSIDFNIARVIDKGNFQIRKLYNLGTLLQQQQQPFLFCLIHTKRKIQQKSKLNLNKQKNYSK